MKFINNTGYTPGFNSFKNPYNIIPSKNITMRNTPFKLLAHALNSTFEPIGEPRILKPGKDYTFKDASYVLEVPINN